jgi:renin receptor
MNAFIALVTTIYYGVGSYAGTLEFRHLPSSVLQTPSAISSLDSSNIPAFVSSLVGLNGRKFGLVKANVFSRPEAIVVIYLEGEEKFNVPVEGVATINQDSAPEFENSFFDVSTAFPNGGYVLVDSSKEMTGTYDGVIEPDGFRDENEVPLSLLQNEISNAKGLLKWAKAHKSSLVNGTPDEFIIRFSGLDSAKTEPGVDFDSARAQVKQLLIMVTDTFSQVYDGNVAVLLAQMDPFPHVRKPRATSNVKASSGPVKYTDLLWYDKHYPAAFNIILFSCIFLVLAVFAIGSGMWFIDPGRDSIIYRMTTTRAKKD